MHAALYPRFSGEHQWTSDPSRRAAGGSPLDGVVAWISLVQTDKGKEQPIYLEDWSAHKAITAQTLQPGETVETDWPMRLIQAGTYRDVISRHPRGFSSVR